MSRINFREVALETTQLSDLFTDKALNANDVSGKKLTIVAAGMVEYTKQKIIDGVVAEVKNKYPIVHFAEFPGCHYCGGVVLKKIVERWLEVYEGDEKTMNTDLAISPVSVSLDMGKTNNGDHDCMLVRVL